MSVRILTDSAADLTREEIAGLHIDGCAQLAVHFGEECHVIGQTITREAYWQRLMSGEDAKTSQPSPQEFLRLFEEAEAAGDDVVYIGLSSALSGTIQSALLARSMVQGDGIYIVDSLSATVGQKQLIIAACRLRDQGHNAAQIAKEVTALRSRLRVIATVDTLAYLARGGRLSRSAAAIGTLAQLKPQIAISAEGAVEVFAKSIGRHRAIETLVKKVSESDIDPDYPIIPVYSYDDANLIAFKKKLAAAGFACDDALTTDLGAVIGTHAGPNANGVCFVVRA